MILDARWKTILRRAWSVRLMVLAAILSGLEVAFPFFAPGSMPDGLFGAVSLVLTISAFIARFIAQEGL